MEKRRFDRNRRKRERLKRKSRNGNYLIHKETGRVALIDHGLCFPDNFSEYHLNPDLYEHGEIPKELFDRLENADWNSFFEKMEKSGLSDEAIDGFTERFNRIIGDGTLPPVHEIFEMQEEARWRAGFNAGIPV